MDDSSNWYDNGGSLSPAAGTVVNETSDPIQVYADQGWQYIQDQYGDARE